MRIKVGIIGTGFIGPAHVEALRRLGYVDIVALADINEETAKLKADMLFIPVAYGDYRDLIKDPDISVVHICTPNHLHYQMAKEAMLAGKHVICEKPLAMDSKQAAELVEIAQEKKALNAVGFNLRFYPLVLQVRSMIKSGELGEIFAINGSYQQDWLFYQTDYNWRLEPDYSGNTRAIADIGSHWLDMVEFMTNTSVNKLCADFATFHKTRKKPRKEIETYSGKLLSNDDYEEVSINTEDYASVLLRFANGAHGSLTVNQVAAGRKNRIFFEIYGSKKSVAWSGENPNQLWIGNRDESNQIMLKDPSLTNEDVRNFISFPGGHNEGFPDTSKQLFTEFYQSILFKNSSKGDHTFATFKDGLRELVLTEKIYQSTLEERWIDA